MSNVVLTKNQRRNLRKKQKKLKLREAKLELATQGMIPLPKTRRRKNKKTKQTKASRVQIVNYYLKQLCDPEQGEMKGIPDEFEHLTAVIRPKISRTLPYLLNPYGDTPVGTYLVWNFPNLLCSTHILTESTILNTVRLHWNDAMEFSGLINPHGHDTPDDNTSLTGDFKSFYGSLIYNDTENHPTFPFKGHHDVIGDFFGVPSLCSSYTAPPWYGTLHVNFSREIPPSQELHWRVVSQDGFGVLASGSAVGTGDNIIEIGGLFAGIVGDQGIPGMGIQLRMVDNASTNVTTEWFPTSILFDGWVGPTASLGEGGVESYIRMTPFFYPDQATYSNSVTKYRTIALSSKISWTATAFQGGKATSLYYAGGEDPGYAGFSSFDNISDKRGAYSGSTNEGTYSFWVPDSREHLEFRPYTKAVDPTEPYIVSSGVISNTVGVSFSPGYMKITVSHLVELVSESQFYTYNWSNVQPQLVSQAHALLRALPKSMGNPDHVERIREFFKEIARIGINVGQFVYENRDTILPLAKSIATAAGIALL